MQFLEEKKSHQHCKNAIVDFKIRFLRLQFTYHIIKRKVCFKKVMPMSRTQIELVMNLGSIWTIS